MCAEHFQRLADGGLGVAGVRVELRDIGPVKVFASTGVDLPPDPSVAPSEVPPPLLDEKG